MIQDQKYLETYYFKFNRTHWSTLRDSMSMRLTEEDLIKLKLINKDISLEEVTTIYLPILKILDLYISTNWRQKALIQEFIGTCNRKTPYIIGVTGSVAAGKSTIARLLQAILSNLAEYRSVDVITTDNFLYPNKILNERGLMKKKGFPQSYDMRSMLEFVQKIKSGAKKVTTSIYSHMIYDILPNANKVIRQPDILILEGLNVLQHEIDGFNNPHRIFISDFIDFSIYVDAPEILLQNWYINRCLEFRNRAFYDPTSYFYNYTQISEDEAANIAIQIWNEINSTNLKENILPTRKRATLILTKRINHEIDCIHLRK